MVATALGVLSACQAPSPKVSEASNVHIRLTRGVCFGWCPAYAVDIAGDGAVTYEGFSSVAVSGRFQDRIAPSEVAALVGMFERADFFSLKDEYIAEITDSPFYSVSLTVDGKTKKVMDYVGKMAGMPDAVTRLEDEIDRIAGTQKYVKGTPETVRMMRNAGFDFTSAKAAPFLADALEIESYAYAADLIEAGVPLNGHTTRQDLPVSALLNPLMFPPTEGREKVARALCAAALKRGSRQDRALALIIAATFDDIDLARRLIAMGVDPAVDDPQIGVYTALHAASSAAMARILLDAGIDAKLSGPVMTLPILSTESEEVALILFDVGNRLSSDTRSELAGRAREKGWTRLLAKLGA